MNITIQLPDELADHAGRLAVAQGRTLNDLVEEAVRRLISGRVLPRVSTASGGVLVDTVKTSELLEMLDEDLPLEKRR